jgi:uncharacterized protein (DUF885 family)
MTLRRRSFVQSVGAAALATSVPAAARAAGQARPGAGDAVLRALLDRIFNDRMTQSPESATALGLDIGKNATLKSQLSGRSAADEDQGDRPGDAG